MKRLLLLVALQGCASVPADEYVWQTLHAVDVAQTVQIAKNPRCYRESDPITSRLIGEHPSTQGAIAWGVGTAVLHAGVSNWLENIDAKPWVKGAWKVLSFGSVGITIANNYSDGLRVNGSEDC